MAGDPLIGGVLSRKYLIVRLIGRGGMGRVYEAEHQRLGKTCAIKVLNSEIDDDDGSLRARFLWEPRMASEFDHPNIIRVRDVDEDDGRLYIVMDLIQGSDLRAILRNGPLSPERALLIVGQAAAALDHAHARGLIHRDVKPANILVGEADHVVLTDFGLAKSADRAQSLTVSGGFFGSISYAAPEQFDSRGAEPASDRYALGCVLWECLAGYAPFAGDSDLEIIRGHLHGAVPRIAGDFPTAALGEVFEKALAKDPVTRYTSASEFVDAATAALAEAASGHVRARPARRKRPPAARTGRPATKPPAPTPAARGQDHLDEAAPSPPAAPDARAPEHPVAVVRSAAETRGAAQRLGQMLRRPAAIAAVTLPLAAVGGLALGILTGTTTHLPTANRTVTQPAPKPKSITAHGLTLTLPATWNSRALPASLATAAKRPGVYVSTAAYPDRFLAVFVPTAKFWLPHGVSAQPATAVKLGAREALRLQPAAVRLGHGTQSRVVMTPYVTSTSRGDVLIACGRTAGPSAATSKARVGKSFQHECERLASTLRIKGARPLRVLPLASGITSVRGALQELSSDRKAQAKDLRSTKRATQIEAASSLAESYHMAATRVTQLRAALGIRGARSRVLADLRSEERAFADLASAGSRGSTVDWRTAADTVANRDEQLRDDVQELDAALAGKTYSFGS